jgi:hypothetical protein
MERMVTASLLAFAVTFVTACGANSPALTMPSQAAPSPPQLSSTFVPAPPQSQFIPAPVPPASSTDRIVGQYGLTLSVGSECAAVPEFARDRSYTATINSSTTGGYVITLSDAFFLQDPICGASGVCNEFVATREADAMGFQATSKDDESDAGEIWELIPPGMWLQVRGSAVGQIQGSRIDASLDGGLWYCPGQAIPCRSFVACHSSNMKLVFTRR